MQTRLDFGRLRIPAGGDSTLETFVLGYFDDARLGLETYADAIAKVYKVKLPQNFLGFRLGILRNIPAPAMKSTFRKCVRAQQKS
jgi:hypothetical protein